MTHDVNRWHSNKHLRNTGDTILRHQWRVVELLTSLWPDAPRAAIDYAASHDEQEALQKCDWIHKNDKCAIAMKPPPAVLRYRTRHADAAGGGRCSGQPPSCSASGQCLAAQR